MYANQLWGAHPVHMPDLRKTVSFSNGSYLRARVYDHVTATKTEEIVSARLQSWDSTLHKSVLASQRHVRQPGNAIQMVVGARGAGIAVVDYVPGSEAGSTFAWTSVDYLGSNAINEVMTYGMRMAGPYVFIDVSGAQPMTEVDSIQPESVALSSAGATMNMVKLGADFVSWDPDREVVYMIGNREVPWRGQNFLSPEIQSHIFEWNPDTGAITEVAQLPQLHNTIADSYFDTQTRDMVVLVQSNDVDEQTQLQPYTIYRVNMDTKKVTQQKNLSLSQTANDTRFVLFQGRTQGTIYTFNQSGRVLSIRDCSEQDVPAVLLVQPL